VYVPSGYRPVGDDWPRWVIGHFPLALLLTNGDQVPHATHLPIVPDPGAPADGPLVGTTLLGHLNRANPHWPALAGGGAARLVFTGPHSYITPTIYRVEPAAPTWNYVSVHLAGELEPITEIAETLAVVRRTVTVFEGKMGDGWSYRSSLCYFDELAPGVGAFRFHVNSVDAMFKLSQEKDPATRERVIARLRTANSGTARDLAGVMDMFGADRSAPAGEATVPVPIEQ
jgi:transcriptional regulator